MARQPLKCCYCVPLRTGLLAWAYIKLVIALTSIAVYLSRYEMRNFVAHFNDTLTNYYSSFKTPPEYLFQQLGPLCVCLLYLVFSIIFFIGVRRGNIKLLQVFQVYSIFEIMAGAAAVDLQLYYLQASLSEYNYYHIYNQFTGEYVGLHYTLYDIVFYLGLILPVVINILLPMYFIVLIKREVQCLKTARKEPRVVLGVPVTKDQDKTYNFV